MLCQLSYVVRSVRVCDISELSLVPSISMQSSNHDFSVLDSTEKSFFKILIMEIVWIFVENSMEIQFSYTNRNFHNMEKHGYTMVYGFSDSIAISIERI